MFGHPESSSTLSPYKYPPWLEVSPSHTSLYSILPHFTLYPLINTLYPLKDREMSPRTWRVARAEEEEQESSKISRRKLVIMRALDDFEPRLHLILHNKIEKIGWSSIVEVRHVVTDQIVWDFYNNMTVQNEESLAILVQTMIRDTPILLNIEILAQMLKIPLGERYTDPNNIEHQRDIAGSPNQIFNSLTERFTTEYKWLPYLHLRKDLVGLAHVIENNILPTKTPRGSMTVGQARILHYIEYNIPISLPYLFI